VSKRALVQQNQQRLQTTKHKKHKKTAVFLPSEMFIEHFFQRNKKKSTKRKALFSGGGFTQHAQILVYLRAGGRTWCCLPLETPSGHLAATGWSADDHCSPQHPKA
jgi:hypothetical protein